MHTHIWTFDCSLNWYIEILFSFWTSANVLQRKAFPLQSTLPFSISKQTNIYATSRVSSNTLLGEGISDIYCRLYISCRRRQFMRVLVAIIVAQQRILLRGEMFNKHLMLSLTVNAGVRRLYCRLTQHCKLYYKNIWVEKGVIFIFLIILMLYFDIRWNILARAER